MADGSNWQQLELIGSNWQRSGKIRDWRCRGLFQQANAGVPVRA